MSGLLAVHQGFFMSLPASHRSILKTLTGAMIARIPAPAESWLMLCSSRNWPHNKACLPPALQEDL